MYDRQIECFHKRVERLKNYIDYMLKSKVHISVAKENEVIYDLYVILSDDILMIQKYIKSIKNKDKIIIITQNKNIDHIIKCVNITKNMYYLYSSDEYLFNKFKRVYESNLAKYN